MPLLHATKNGYRFVVLFFNCLLTFGSYFCFDMPSVLQAQFQGNATCAPHNGTGNQSTDNSSCCEDCLGMSPSDYNLLYAIYAWTNAVVVILAGFLIDKVGNRFGAFLFSGLCVIGSSTFAVGALLKGTKYMLPVMLLGRLIFGSGNGSLTIVQNRLTAFWFKDKELAMAFGITLAFSRLGSVLNFFLTANFEHDYGLSWTLWGGAILCGLGFASALIVGSLDVRGMKQLGLTSNIKIESKKLRVSDVTKFKLQYWLLALAIMFFYNGVFPFVADASKFIQDKYGFEKQTSAYLAGAVYDVSMIISPFLGALIDFIGRRGIMAFLCAFLTLPVFGLLAFSKVYPLVSTLWLGVTYSFAAASLWPSIPLVVSQATIGTAMGVTTSIQMIGMGLSNVIVGQILGTSENIPKEETLHRWKLVMIFLLGNTIACIVVTSFLNFVDRRRGGILNESKKERIWRQQLEAIPKDSSFSNIHGEIDEPSENDPLLPNRPSVNT